ncbi:unnamed protein product [Pedinophyceae sp. YPF-701]|nr:unnamed protein product [Pedinophyceae sp. YPF-701]
MVCTKCEKKLRKLGCQDVWKAGAQNTVKSGGVKLGANKLLKPKHTKISKKGDLDTVKCETCKKGLLDRNYKFCNGCAYRKGVCAMCGKKILDTALYNQSTT